MNHLRALDTFDGIGSNVSKDFDPNTVTPGVVGFIVIFLIAAVTVLLVLDMTKRVRRTRYRGEIREQLDAEESEAAAIARAQADDVIHPSHPTELGTSDDKRTD